VEVLARRRRKGGVLMTLAKTLQLLADAADEVLTNVYDGGLDRNEETDEEYGDIRRLRIMERLARRALRQVE
jgi:hypothetical protein